MADQTVEQRVAELSGKGYTADQISSMFQQKYGMELKSVPRGMNLSTLQTIAKIIPTEADKAPVFGGSTTAPAKPTPSWAERAKNWAGGMVLGIPATAYGALGELGNTAPARVLGKAYDFVNDPFGLGEMAMRAIAPPKPAKPAPEPNRIAEAQAASKALRQSRAGMPTSQTALQDLGDVASGIGHLFVGQGLNVEGPINESPIETAKRRFEQGRQLTAGVIGGTTDVAKGLVTEGPSTNPLRTQPLTTALTVLPVGRAAKLGVRAGAEAAAAKGGVLGKVGQVAAEATRATDILGQTQHGVGQWVKQAFDTFPGGEELFNQIQAEIQAGKLTAQEGAALLQRHMPWQSVFQYSDLPATVRPALQSAGKVGRGAVYGAVLGSTTVGPVAGAAIGAGAAGLMELAKVAKPAGMAKLRAAYRRNVVDPAALDTPAATEILRSTVEEPVRRGAEVRALGEEAAGLMKQGQVAFDYDPGLKPQPTAPYTSERLMFRYDPWDPKETGLFPPAPESAAREAAGELAVGQGRVLDVLQERQGPAAQAEAEAYKANLEQREGGLGWPLALDVEAGLREIGPKGAIPPKTTNPQFEKLVDRAHRTMTAAGQDVPRHWFHRAFTAALDDTSTALNYSPRFRKIVSDEAARFMGINLASKEGKAFLSAIDDKLVSLNSEALGAEPPSFILRNKIGNEMSLQDLQRRAVMAIQRSSSQPAPAWYAKDKRLPPLAEIQEDVMRRVASTLAMQAEDTHLAHAIDRERTRFLAPAWSGAKSHMQHPSGVKDAMSYAGNIVDRVEAGEPLPLITVFNPQEMAARLRQIAESGMSPKGRSFESVLRVAEHLEQMKPISADLAQYMGDQKQLAMIGDTPGTGMWATPGVDASLTARAKLLQVARNADALDKMLARFKISLTALRAKTWVNNMGSNVVLQSVRSGKLPAAVIQDAVKASEGYQQYHQNPASLSPQDLQMYRSLAHGGLGSLAQLGGDFNALKALSSPKGVVGAAVHHTTELAKKGYSYGDMPFKVAEATDRYRQTMADLSKLNDGEWANLRISQDSVAHLVKVGDRFQLNGVDLLPEQLSDLVGKGAVKFAQDSFINTAHSPVWLQKLHSGRFVNLASPFLSWAWGALEAPGKHGLLRNALFFDGNSLIDTNNPALLTRNAARSLVLGARRDALIRAVQTQLHPQRDEIRKIFPYAFGNEGAVDIQKDPSDPFSVRTHDYGPMNPFSRAALAWRLSQASLGQAYSALGLPMSKLAETGDFESLSPEDKRRVKFFTNLKSKQVATATDALDAASLSGNFLLDLARDLQAASAPGSKVSTDIVLAKFMLNLVGGSAADLARVTYGTFVDPMDKIAGRPRIHEGEKAGPADAISWATQTLLGIGYQDVGLYGEKGKILRYVSNFKAALTNSMAKGLKDKIDMISEDRSIPPDVKADQIVKINEEYSKVRQWVDQAVDREKQKLYQSSMKFTGLTDEEHKEMLDVEKKTIKERRQEKLEDQANESP